nr:hypothetical membrane protein [uncultured archaeon]
MSSMVASNQVFKFQVSKFPSSKLVLGYSITWLLGHSATRPHDYLVTRLLGYLATWLLTFYVFELINYLMLLIKPFSIAMISSNSGINLSINSLSP